MITHAFKRTSGQGQCQNILLLLSTRFVHQNTSSDLLRRHSAVVKRARPMTHDLRENTHRPIEWANTINVNIFAPMHFANIKHTRTLN